MQEEKISVKGIFKIVYKVKKMISNMPKVIRVVYKNGVFKPLEKVDIEEGRELRIRIERDVEKLRGKYKSIKADMLELRDEIYDRRTHIRR